MKLSRYVYDKGIQIIVFLSCYFIILMMLQVFKIPKTLIMAVTIVFMILGVLLFFIDYIRKYFFYKQLVNIVEELDKKYLVLEMISKPHFYEGELLYQLLYDINKSMLENVKNYEMSIIDFKEYVEMWIHEVKIPISSLMLMYHNHREKIDKKYVEQIKKLDNYIDQVLYYVRSENAEKDYLIKNTELLNIINKVALKNKDDLLENKINFIVDGIDEYVLTDSKWLEFILNQIINNSIKYKKEKGESFIQLSTNKRKQQVDLIIYDNGIGIPESDVLKVFDKSFTGENGRKKAKSTGMGLYIARNLCEKLGHELKIESVYGEYTKVIITFSKNDFYRIED